MKNLQRSLFGPFQARKAEEEIFRVQVAESARPVDLPRRWKQIARKIGKGWLCYRGLLPQSKRRAAVCTIGYGCIQDDTRIVMR